jgi:hypothetical protein
MTATTVGTSTISATSGSVSNSATVTVTAPTNNNVMAVTVNGSLCSDVTSANYPNKPCVSVTVCTPDNSQCTTIKDILLDTGSIGLRVFKSALNSLPLQQVSTSNGGSLAECVQFADFSAIWGPVQRASVVLGNETPVQIPIQVIDATFGAIPVSSACQNADKTPLDAGYNGVLGVGLFSEDCGPGCTGVHSENGFYFSCNGSGCSGVSATQANQVQNPVAHLPTDNNGVVVKLPSVPLGGLGSLSGQLLLGIGTQANNASNGATRYPTTGSADFTTVFKGATFSNSFIDTGSNAYFFADSGTAGLPLCSDPNWYCPPSTVSLSATTTGAGGSPSATVPFRIGNFDALQATGNSVFAEIGGPSPGSFDWGLPFFFGRSVFVGIEGTTSPLGTGPYWAY